MSYLKPYKNKKKPKEKQFQKFHKIDLKNGERKSIDNKLLQKENNFR